jgi:tight adherence protein B
MDLVLVIIAALCAGLAAAMAAVTWQRPAIGGLGGGLSFAELLGADAFGHYNEGARTTARMVGAGMGAVGVVVLFGPLGAVVGIPIGVILAQVAISRANDMRRRNVDTQLPDAIDQLVSLIRGKHSLESSIERLARTTPRDIASVFARVANRETLVSPLEGALKAISDEAKNNRHVQLLFAALAVFCREGGNAIEPMQRMSTTFKQILRLSEKIDTASAQAWGTFRMINYAAIFMVITIWTTQPQLLQVLSTTTIGIILSIVCAVIWMSGFLLMRQAMKIMI